MIHPQCWPRPPTSKIWPWSRGQLELLIDENTVLLLSSAEGDSLPSKIPNPALGVSHLGFWFTVSLRGPLVTTSWMRQCMWVGWITMDSGDNCTAVRVTWYSTNDLLHIYCIINIIQQCRISTSTYVFFILSVVRFVKCWVGRNVLYHTTHRRIQDLPLGSAGDITDGNIHSAHLQTPTEKWKKWSKQRSASVRKLNHFSLGRTSKVNPTT